MLQSRSSLNRSMNNQVRLSMIQATWALLCSQECQRRKHSLSSKSIRLSNKSRDSKSAIPSEMQEVFRLKAWPHSLLERYSPYNTPSCWNYVWSWMTMISTKQLQKPARRRMVTSYTGSKMTAMRKDKLSTPVMLKKSSLKHSKRQQLDRKGPLLKLILMFVGSKAKS